MEIYNSGGLLISICICAIVDVKLSLSSFWNRIVVSKLEHAIVVMVQWCHKYVGASFDSDVSLGFIIHDSIGFFATRMFLLIKFLSLLNDLGSTCLGSSPIRFFYFDFFCFIFREALCTSSLLLLLLENQITIDLFGPLMDINIILFSLAYFKIMDPFKYCCTFEACIHLFFSS